MALIKEVIKREENIGVEIVEGNAHE